MRLHAPIGVPLRPRLRRWAAGLGLLLLAAGAGCRDAAAPEPAAAAGDFAFVPADTAATVVAGSWFDFRVVPRDGLEPRVRWRRPGESDAAGERFRYFGREPGTETLDAVILLDQAPPLLRRWRVTVIPAGLPRVEFLPEGPVATAYATVEATFRARSFWPLGPVHWTVDGAAAAGDSVLRVVPSAPGLQTVVATAAFADSIVTHEWRMDVRPFAEARPPAVTGLAAGPGAAPGCAVLSWTRTDGSVLPLVGYEVRWSAAGPPTEAGWETAADPGGHPWVPWQARHEMAYASEDAGLEPGQQVWFAVRARNERGQLSPIDETAALRLPDSWWIEGTVTAPDGSPLAGITVEDSDHRHAALTDAAGGYRIGPYFELAGVVVEAGTPADAPAGASWHLARSDTLTFAGPRRRDFVLLPRRGSAPGCFVFGSHFQAYLRTMTRTRVPSDGRPDVDLHHWTSYPVPVHAPAWTSPLGVDYGACAVEAVLIWNSALGLTAFELVDDPGLARISIRYDLDGGAQYGVLEMDEPGGGELAIGEATPEHVSARVTPAAPDAKPVTEILLHELGHALGLHAHAGCVDVDYLMYVSALGALDNGPERAIHPDELAAVRTIMLLPDGWDMGVYPLDVP